LDRFIVKRFDLDLWTLRLDFEFTYRRVKILADNYVANGRIVSNPIVDRKGHFEMDLFGKFLRVSNSTNKLIIISLTRC
jgi:hypothetical protein